MLVTDMYPSPILAGLKSGSAAKTHKSHRQGQAAGGLQIETCEGAVTDEYP